MSPTSAMMVVRRNSTASIDADLIRDDSFNMREFSPVSSAHGLKSPRGLTPKDEAWRQSRAESPRHFESLNERRSGPGFYEQDGGYSERRQLSSDRHRGRGDHEDCSRSFDSRGDRGRSLDRRGINRGLEMYSSSQERFRQNDPNNKMRYPQNYDDLSYGSDYRSSGSDAMQRTASLDRYNRNFANMARYGQNYYDNARPQLTLSVSKELLSRRSDYQERMSLQSRQEKHADDETSENYRFANDFLVDKQGRFTREQSRRRRTQSLGRYERRPMFDSGFGNSQFDEGRHGSYRPNMPRSTGHYYKPSAPRKNRFCEMRRYGESDGYVPYNSLTSSGSQFDIDRFAVDRFGFDRFGVDEFGYDRNGNCVDVYKRL